MQILLQDRQTKQFVKPDEQWTDNASDGLTFHTCGRAFAYCSKRNWFDMDVVLKFQNERYDVRLPINQ